MNKNIVLDTSKVIAFLTGVTEGTIKVNQSHGGVRCWNDFHTLTDMLDIICVGSPATIMQPCLEFRLMQLIKTLEGSSESARKEEITVWLNDFFNKYTVSA